MSVVENTAFSSSLTGNAVRFNRCFDLDLFPSVVGNLLISFVIHCSFTPSTQAANMSLSFRLLLVTFLFAFAAQVFAQTGSSATLDTPPITSSATASATASGTGTPTTSAPNVSRTSTAPDVLLLVPELHVGRIELVVEKLQADLNLNAKVAGLVTINAGVAVSVEKVNITIADVDVNLELVVRLGNLVQIVERVFDSLDLNPLLLSLVGNVTNLVGEVIGAVDGLVSTIMRIRYQNRGQLTISAWFHHSRREDTQLLGR